MSERLEVVLAELVRQALRKVRRRRSQATLERKRAAIRKALEHAAPTADIDQMLAEIESAGVRRLGG